MHCLQYTIPYSGKHWQIQLFGLFGEENFGEWPTNKIQTLNIP